MKFIGSERMAGRTVLVTGGSGGIGKAREALPLTTAAFAAR